LDDWLIDCMIGINLRVFPTAVDFTAVTTVALQHTFKNLRGFLCGGKHLLVGMQHVKTSKVSYCGTPIFDFRSFGCNCTNM